MRLVVGALGIAVMLIACAAETNGTVMLPDDDTPSEDVLPDPTPKRDASAPDVGKPIQDAGTVSEGGTVNPTNCKGTSSCPVPIVSGSVSGDKGADTITLNGTTSGWYSIRVTENDGSVSGRKLKFNATLTPGGSSNYDLFLYDNAPGDCVTPWLSSTQPTGTDSASSSWGEGSFANGKTDDKEIYFEVRHISGTCDAAASWSLLIQGNTN